MRNQKVTSFTTRWTRKHPIYKTFASDRNFFRFSSRFHLRTLVIFELDFNQNFFTFTLVLLMIKMVMCSDFPWTQFIDYMCFHMRLGPSLSLWWRSFRKIAKEEVVRQHQVVFPDGTLIVVHLWRDTWTALSQPQEWSTHGVISGPPWLDHASDPLRAVRLSRHNEHSHTSHSPFGGRRHAPRTPTVELQNFKSKPSSQTGWQCHPHSSRFENNGFAAMWSSSKEVAYVRLIDFCITQL